MRLYAALTALLLSGVAVSSDTEIEDADSVSEIGLDTGRLGVINEHTREIWLKMRSDSTAHRKDDPADLAATLRHLVWQYNELRAELCVDRFMIADTCGPPYLPKWALGFPKSQPSTRELRERQAELEERVVLLWDRACERLRKVIPNEESQGYCSVE